MNPLQSHYVREVLGVSDYLVSPETSALRRFRGSLPCKILIVVRETLADNGLKLLKKMMKALQVSSFSILEIKGDVTKESLKQFFDEEKPASQFLIFHPEWKEFFKAPNVIVTEPLPVFLEVTQDCVRKKQELWSELKKWKK